MQQLEGVTSLRAMCTVVAAGVVCQHTTYSSIAQEGWTAGRQAALKQEFTFPAGKIVGGTSAVKYQPINVN